MEKFWRGKIYIIGEWVTCIAKTNPKGKKLVNNILFAIFLTPSFSHVWVVSKVFFIEPFH